MGRCHSKIKDALRPWCSREERTLLGTTHVNGAIHTHAASIMNIHIDAIGGLVSNPSERETRGSRGRTAPPLNLEVGTFSSGESHIAKRDIGQLSNRKLMDPSYLGKTTKTHTHSLPQVSSSNDPYHGRWS